MNLTGEELAERTRAMEDYLNGQNNQSDKEYRISVSYGVSRENPTNIDQNYLLQRADHLMYAAKQEYKAKRKL